MNRINVHFVCCLPNLFRTDSKRNRVTLWVTIFKYMKDILKNKKLLKDFNLKRQ